MCWGVPCIRDPKDTRDVTGLGCEQINVGRPPFPDMKTDWPSRLLLA